MKKLAFLTLLASPAQADCAGDWAALSGALEKAGLTVNVAAPAAEWGGWCSITALDVLAPGDFIPDYSAKSLKWRGKGLSGLYAFDAQPEHLEIDLDDFRILTKTPDPVMTYLMRAQSVRGAIDLEFDADWNPSQKTLEINTLELGFPGDNEIALQATLTGVDLSGRSAIMGSATSFALNRLQLGLETNGLFETYLLFPLFSTLLSTEQPPETQMAALKTQINSGIAALPDTSFPTETKASLTAMIDQLPNPSGTLNLTMTSDKGIGPAQTLPFILTGVPRSVQDLAPLFNGMNVTATFSPSEQEADDD
ncbi:hypothetical protein [Neogemmobacter tilapiae]|uniref:DUF2125 domain-containing protein n=1 Tax=Neogemmobacter tilapiae TaxID=875041 RepID=A0A918TGG1_9RHOB|nr:hypothetical protein [Gemmobacter tilapiae]GHC45041.1 hypothetical protein GCM10007315_02930 [Gemmobacter tilapiae]